MEKILSKCELCTNQKLAAKMQYNKYYMVLLIFNDALRILGSILERV
jgi:hypothetical protein